MRQSYGRAVLRSSDALDALDAFSVLLAVFWFERRKKKNEEKSVDNEITHYPTVSLSMGKRGPRVCNVQHRQDRRGSHSSLLLQRPQGEKKAWLGMEGGCTLSRLQLATSLA